MDTVSSSQLEKFPDLRTYVFEDLPYKLLMQNRIYNVLIVCSNYDFYLLEEDGRIDEQIFNEYTDLNLRRPPDFLHAYSGKSALSVLNKTHVDLVIVWVDTSSRALEISKTIREEYSEIPIAALSHYSSELHKITNTEDKGVIDFVFHWSGNINIFIAIIKLVEDSMNAQRDINSIGVKAILLVEDSLRFYSRYIPLIYKVIWKQTELFVQEGFNEHHKMMSKRGRPKILLARNYEEAVRLFEEYKDSLLGVISDVSFKREGERDKKAGLLFTEYILSYNSHIPVIIQSSDKRNKKLANRLGVQFLHKQSETLGLELRKLIGKYFSFGEFEFWDPEKKKVVYRAKNLKELQRAIEKVSLQTLAYHAERNDFSKWLQSRALFPLAKLFSNICYSDFSRNEHIQEFLSDSIQAFRRFRTRGVIAKFDKKNYDEYLVFSRIGDGALGGKGRGLAFVDSFIKRHGLAFKYEGVHIGIPRTVVLSASVFDEFMEKHNLFSFVSKNTDDRAILEKFISKSLPRWVREEIKVFLSTLSTPVAIRSSSVLEDSLYQPFAGVFSTYMVPYSTDKTLFVDMVSNAIKSVMASAFYKQSRAYIKATSHDLEENKMAVILQEVVGKQYDDVYYPTLSGVARSLNYYPIGDEKASEGVVQIGMGLGEYIVQGGQGIRFSPYHPKKILQLSNPQVAQRESQKYFIALDMNPEAFRTSLNENVNKRKIRIRRAKNHSSLKYVASTYDLQNNVLRPGVMHDGIRLITFEQILKYDSFPLAEILKELLRIGRREMQYPVEMEFAVNLDTPPGQLKTFSFLQIRPIVELHTGEYRIPKKIDMKEVLLYTESALGNGSCRDLRDIVYIKPDQFDKSKTKQMATMVEEINKRLENEGRHYILIGPGRWGSTDPWLGIPVVWSQISSAKVIVESGLKDYRIDPSQGSHFFQNLTSFKVGYLSLNTFLNQGRLDYKLLDSLPAEYENEFIRHVRLEKPLHIIIDGKESKAIIYKPGYPK